MDESHEDAKRGSDQADSGGYTPEETHEQQKSGSQPQQPKFTNEDFEPIKKEVYDSPCYEKCQNIGKAVVVSNFMESYKGKPECRTYASEDCETLQKVLTAFGFEPLDGTDMVHKNLTKKEFTELYKKAAEQNNYRPREEAGYTCVLFIVMSYGKAGLIKCHRETDQGCHEYVELKHLQEAFQPQNNGSLALKPKIFIIQTIPETETKTDDNKEETEKKSTTRRIPREADFLTYTCDSYCLDTSKRDTVENIFVKSIVQILEGQRTGEPALEIQKLLIRINNEFKKKRDERRRDWKIPCVTSSLTKMLHLVPTESK